MISEIRNKIVVSILIPIHNRIEVTKKGLYSINQALSEYYRNSTDCNVHYDVVVIDDGSLDGSSEYIEKYYPQYILLKGDGNLWWSGAINKGVKYAISKLSSEYILLWNNDIIPKKNYFIELEKAILKNSNSIIGSYIFNFSSKKVWSEGGWFNVYTGKRSMHCGRIKTSKYVYRWLTGMGTLIPVKFVKQFGCWNSEKFPQYHGDFDFTLRMSKKGVNIINDKKLILFNKTEYSSKAGFDLNSYIKSLSEIGSRYNIRKDIMMYRKHCISPFWIISFLKKHIIYLIQTFIIHN